MLYWYLNDKYNTLIESAKQHGNDIDSIADLFFANLQQRFGEKATVAGALLSSIGDVSYELIRRMAIFYFAFAAYAYFAKLALQDKLTKRVWLVFAVTNIVVLIGFSIYNSFLVSRYTMATALTLLILAPFTINQLWSTLAHAQTSKKIAAFLMFCLLGLASINGLNVITSKTHIKEAGQWMQSNLAAGSSLYSNNRLMVYYSHLDPDGALNHLYSNYQMAVFINNKHIYNFDFISLETNPDDKPKTELRRALNFRFGYPLKIIEGNDGNSVFIYQTANPVNKP